MIYKQEVLDDIQRGSGSSDRNAKKAAVSVQPDIQTPQTGPRCVREKDPEFASLDEEAFGYGRVTTGTIKLI